MSIQRCDILGHDYSSGPAENSACEWIGGGGWAEQTSADASADIPRYGIFSGTWLHCCWSHRLGRVVALVTRAWGARCMCMVDSVAPMNGSNIWRHCSCE